ncbi:AmmeMemoRadiSam system radical SAM enzyme [Candidatus Pacearchaeota archaeon RBG_19FT_COMBO_34_9]|nr:MAG: AmmeMemoRadiSam system radical SAM enzyme [Candidatus Pacearchaeota archaeon RBG_19FT_COMBO_34_9]OGJ15929.1 MAG: AmmeMemoRadiSam system radical SAM enzyme [Candidatus Pacearchaeota archaeon RBG_13_33_26]
MKECDLYKKEKDRIRCFACSHKCFISKGKTGICGVRKNIGNKLYLLVYGKVASMNIDPIEKKPLYHFLPGTFSFSIGTVGCNFRCGFCQNFEISQIKERQIFGKDISPEEIVQKAIKSKCKSISYTYTEPAIFIEFVKDIAKLAKKKKLKNILVTNGFFTKESFDYITDYVDAMNIDLKSFSDEFYRKICGGRLEPVLETIKRAHKKGIHLEITTLVIPGENDSEKEFEQIAKFISSVDKNIPWHISRFFPIYKMQNRDVTPLLTLKIAEKIGKKYLKYVHVGNI